MVCGELRWPCLGWLVEDVSLWIAHGRSAFQGSPVRGGCLVLELRRRPAKLGESGPVYACHCKKVALPSGPVARACEHRHNKRGSSVRACLGAGRCVARPGVEEPVVLPVRPRAGIRIQGVRARAVAAL